MSIELKYFPIRFENKDNQYFNVQHSGKIISDYLKSININPEGCDIIVEGKNETLEFIPKDNTEIIITPKIKHPVVVAWTALVAWASANIVQAVLWTIFIGYSIYQAISAKKTLATFGSSGSGLDASSPTYGWEGIRTISEVGVPVKVVYGEHRTGGNIINQFISYKTTEEYNWWNDESYITNKSWNEGIQLFTINEPCTAVNFYFQNGGSYLRLILTFKIEYKKTTDSEWTLWETITTKFSGKIPSGAFFSELTPSTYNFRITISGYLGHFFPRLQKKPIEAKINRPSTSDINKQYLNVLISVGEGEIESIDDILINDNPIENYKDIDVFYRYGTNDQTPIAGFQDLHNLYPIDIQLLKNSDYTYTTYDSDVEGFQIQLTCPAGIYQVNDDGNIKSWNVSYLVEYKSTSSGDWISLGTYTINGKSQSAIRRIFRKDGLTVDKYDIRITRTSDDSSLDPQKTGDLYLTSIDEIKTDNLSYPNTALLGIKALATEQLSGSTPNFTFVIKGKKVSIPKVLTEEDGDEVDWESYYYDPTDEGMFKLFSDDSELYWDGSFTTKWSANPIWCLKDLLLNTRYGAGFYIESDNLNDAELLENALYCEGKVPDGEGGYEKRFRLDVVIDSPSSVPDILTQLCATFRAFAFNSTGGVSINIDKPSDMVQLFGMGNIIKNSFQQSWKSKKENYNCIEVQFIDESLDYQEETIAIQDDESLGAGEPLRTKSIRLFVKKKSYAIREGRYALWIAKYINRSIGFKAGIDAIATRCGQMAGISHDVPQWGFSGRVLSGSTTTLVKLDRAVELETGKTYAINVRFSDDMIEESVIDEVAGSYTEVHIGPSFTQEPKEFDVYSFGETEKVVKQFKLLGISRGNNGEVNLSGVEYNEDIYDDSDIDIPENDYSASLTDLPVVTDLVLSERIVKLKDSTIENVIDVWFNKPDITKYQIKKYWKAKVYISDNDGESWIYRGETIEDNFQIQGDIADLTTYLVAVVSVSIDGKENSIEASPQEEISIVGKSAPPENITGFDVYQQGSFLKFTWDAVSDIDLARYQIRKGKNWNNADVIIEKIDTTDAIYPVGEVGEITFMIKAIDTSGNESLIPSSDTLIVVPPADTGFMQIFDLWSIPLDWKLTNINLEMRNLHNAGFNRACLALSTADKWEDKDGTSTDSIILDDVFESAGEFEMMKSYDIGFKISFNVIVDADYVATDNCTLTIQISTSDDDITYSAFADIDANTLYEGRYVKYKVKIDTIDTDYNLILYDLSLLLNSSNLRTERGQDIAIPVEGKTITFTSGFVTPPLLKALNIVNGIVGLAVVDNKTKDSMLIMVYDLNGDPIGTAEVDYEVVGA